MKYDHLCGTHSDPRAVLQAIKASPSGLFSIGGRHLTDIGKGKVTLLHKVIEEAAGEFHSLVQTAPDCASMAGAGGAVTVIASDIVTKRQNEKWPGWVATEPLYAGSRVEIGRNQLGRSGGSVIAWIVECLRDMGTLHRLTYPSHDLRRYSGRRAEDWGRPGHGVPDVLEPTMRLHPINDFAQFTRATEARDGLANGCGAIISSMWAFKSKRDRDGYLVRDRRNSWPHAWYCHGYDDRPGHEGIIWQNSWPTDWISGPHGDYELPPGSGKVRPDDFEDAIATYGDSWIVDGYVGFPKRNWDMRPW